MSFQLRKQALIRDFSDLHDPEDRFTYIIERGRGLERLPVEFCQQCYRVRGCLSQLWLVPSFLQGICNFRVDSDAEIPRGIAAILVSLVDGLSPEEIIAADFEFIKTLGIAGILSPNRRNALSHIITSLKLFASNCELEVNRSDHRRTGTTESYTSGTYIQPGPL